MAGTIKVQNIYYICYSNKVIYSHFMVVVWLALSYKKGGFIAPFPFIVNNYDTPTPLTLQKHLSFITFTKRLRTVYRAKKIKKKSRYF